MASDMRPNPEQPKRATAAPNYFSRPVKLRLATLVAVLGLVIVAMHEAGKPETWERMGFGSERGADLKSALLPTSSHPTEMNVAAEARDEPAYDLIEDRTSINRSAESHAWTRTWERLRDAPASNSVARVSCVQLVGQPDAWRGKWVAVDGMVRGVERTKANNRDIGFEVYHVLWVKPRDSNRTPYCVYVRTLPDGFPRSDGKFLEVNEPVSIVGIFFKLRSYVATNEQIETCPLILADTISWNPVAAAPIAAPWSPPIWLLILFFLGMPIVAAWLAVAAWRGTRIPRFADGPHRQDEIRQTLDSMVFNSEIKSDLDKVRQLSRFNDD